jgi:aspartate ammonia-lyase
MDKQAIYSLLQQNPLFQTLTEGALHLLKDSVEIRNFKPGHYVFREDQPREAMYVVSHGLLEIIRERPGQSVHIAEISDGNFAGEGTLFEDRPHNTSCRAVKDTALVVLTRKNLDTLFERFPQSGRSLLNMIARGITQRLDYVSYGYRTGPLAENLHNVTTRTEHDLLGELEVPSDAYFGIQTMRALTNFHITGIPLSHFPNLIIALAYVKKAAANTNARLGHLDEKTSTAITSACDEIIGGKYHNQFVVDMIQGGAGTSTNMNANEVIANRALQIMGKNRGDYAECHPNNHVNLSQSTNDVYPTALRLAILLSYESLTKAMETLSYELKRKAAEFSKIIKMGRTQLQDAVPMTLGQEFEAYAVTVKEDIEQINRIIANFREINLGATAIGTGINADPEYASLAVAELGHLTGIEFSLAPNLIEATSDTGAFLMFSGVLRRVSVKISKICNDLRLLSSGPRAGLNEINLPAMQPGSSIMPGKVNPVIPEVVNQVAFQVIGNDLTITMAAEAGQLELNVMEPVIAFNLFQSMQMLTNAMYTLADRAIKGITANREHCRAMVENSIGLVTALNPYIGYENSTRIAKRALHENRSVLELVREEKLLDEEQLKDILKPENMTKPRSQLN